MPPPTTAMSNSSCDSAARACPRSITTAVSQSATRIEIGSSASAANFGPRGARGEGPPWRSDVRQLRGDLGDGRLRIAEHHRGLGVEVELVLDARESRVHRALD